MPVFELKTDSVTMVVRAECISCARNVAAMNAGKEGTMAWRDAAISSVALIRNPSRSGFKEHGRNEMLKRSNHAGKH